VQLPRQTLLLFIIILIIRSP